MNINFQKNLINLALSLDKPLYAVGGVVRNFLIDGSMSIDVDLSAAIKPADFKRALLDFGFTVTAEYPRTNTVLFSDGQRRYEYTAFRREKYVGGEHTPISTEPTDNLYEDALRRDFKCNAVYYDIAKDVIVDPLSGVRDIEDRRLDTVVSPERVFSSDGLRLLRLARFVGELNFTPTVAVIEAAKHHADNILDISPERIYAEMNMILTADVKYPFSSPIGHYRALKVLDETRVLDWIFPELADGRGMAQRADFHKYDVLEHSLRCVAYSHIGVRWGALMHDVGKPFCFRRDGYYYHHFSEGEKIAEKILTRLKAEKATIKQVKHLVKEHMVDLDCSMKESKVRKFLVKNYDSIEQLLDVKQADFRASLEVDYTAPTVVKWRKILSKMKMDGTPFTIKDLKINGQDLMDLGYKDKEIGKELKNLWDFAILSPEKNSFEVLLARAKQDLKKLKNV